LAFCSRRTVRLGFSVGCGDADGGPPDSVLLSIFRKTDFYFYFDAHIVRYYNGHNVISHRLGYLHNNRIPVTVSSLIVDWNSFLVDVVRMIVCFTAKLCELHPLVVYRYTDTCPPNPLAYYFFYYVLPHQFYRY